MSIDFIPSITGGIAPLSFERKLIYLPTKLGRLEILIFSELPGCEYNHSRLLTDYLPKKVLSQERRYENRVIQLRNSQNSEKFSTIRKEMDEIYKEIDEINQGSDSNILTFFVATDL